MVEKEGKKEVGGRRQENAIEMREDKIEHFQVLVLGVGRGRDVGMVHDVVASIKRRAEEQAGGESGDNTGNETGGADEGREKDVSCIGRDERDGNGIR